MHLKYYLEYGEDVSKSKIERMANEFAIRESDYGGGLVRKIQWYDKICNTYDDARCFIEKKDDGDYCQVAVKYRTYPSNLEKSKKLYELEERLMKEKTKLADYKMNHSIQKFKADYVGCSSCGSKLKRNLIDGEKCPLCRTDLRSKTTLDTISKYQSNIKKIKEMIQIEEGKIKMKNIKLSKIKWLVKIEFHV